MLMQLITLLVRLDDEVRCGLAARLRRLARWLDDYPVEYMGPIHGENGTWRLGSDQPTQQRSS